MWNKGLQYTAYQIMKASDPWDIGNIIFLWEVMAIMQGGGMWGQSWTPWTEEKARRVCRKPWQLNLVKKKKKKKSTRKETATQRENSGDTQRFTLEYLAEYWLVHAYEETTQGWAILGEIMRDQGVWWSDRAWNNVYSQQPDWKKEN